MQRVRVGEVELTAPRAAMLVAVLMLGLALEKQGNDLVWEMAWVCHIASYGMCLGLALRSAALASGALVLWAGLTLPSFVFFLVSGGSATLLSWMAHLLPPALCLAFVPPQRWSPAGGAFAVVLALVAWACGAAIVTTWGHPVNLALVPLPLANGGSVAPLSASGLVGLACYLVGVRWLVAWSARRVLVMGSAS